MLSRSRLTRILICVLLGGSTLLAQDRKDRDSDDSGHDQKYLRDSDRQHERSHPLTSPLDYLFLPGFPGSRSQLSVVVDPDHVNGVIAMPFHLDRFFRVGHVSLSLSVPQAGFHAYAGIYDDQGNLLVQGKFPTDEAGDLTVDISPRVLLKPGMYYFAIGGDGGTSASAVGYLFDIGDLNFIHSGLAANPIMDGSLPATLGTITLGQIGSTPSAVFTP